MSLYYKFLQVSSYELSRNSLWEGSNNFLARRENLPHDYL
jgi:hypothetical protein